MILLILACLEPEINKKKYEENFFRCLEGSKIEAERTYQPAISSEVIKECREVALTLSTKGQ